jgi:hypothetical protein
LCGVGSASLDGNAEYGLNCVVTGEALGEERIGGDTLSIANRCCGMGITEDIGSAITCVERMIDGLR